MPTQVQLRRGNTSDTLIFTGAAGEVTVDTDKKTIVVHDGTTSGGHNLSTEANTGAGLITVTNAYQANVGAARIADVALGQANTGAGNITVTNAYQANVGVAIASGQANVGVAIASGQANVGVAIASGQANTGAGLITVTNAYQANTGAVQIAKLDKAGGTITGNLTVSGITTLGNGAILGSPSSVGTMPAFTLGGTVSGGGNQINNVIIGTTTPLAGAFTTLSATGITTLSAANTALLLSGAGSSSTTLANNYAIRINASVTAANYGGIFFDGSTVYDSFFGRVPTALSGINDGVGYVTYTGGAPTLRTLFSSTGLAVTGTLSATGAITGTTIALSGQTADITNATLALLTLKTTDNGGLSAVKLDGKTGGAAVQAWIVGLNRSGTAGTFDIEDTTASTFALTITRATLAAKFGGTLSGGTSGTGYSFSGSAPATSLTLDSSGNLILGAANPNFQGSSSTGSATLINNSGGAFVRVYGGSHASKANFTEFINGSSTSTFDSAGNLGLGVTPSAWSTGKGLEVGFAGSGVYSYSQTDTEFLSNAYYNSGYKFGGSGKAMMYAMGTAGSGIHSWYTSTASGTAGNAITFTQAMTLDASGNLGIGTTSPSTYGKLAVNSTAAGGANVAITKENSGTANQNGQVLYFNNSHAAATGRNANVVAGQIIWQFSQPTSGALQYAGEIAVLSDSQGGASSASSLNLYSSGGLGLTINSAGNTVIAGAMSATGTLSGGTSGTAYSFSGSAPAGSLTLNSSGSLEVSSTAASNTVSVGVTNTDATGFSILQLRNTGASGRTYQIGVGGNTSGQNGNLYIYDATAAAVRAVIDSSGNLGIGATSAGNKLQISNAGANGLEVDVNVASGTESKIISINRTSSDYTPLRYDAASHKFLISGGEQMRLDSSGNLLVGGTTQTDKGVLTVYNNATSFASVQAFAYLKGTQAGDVSMPGLFIAKYDNNSTSSQILVRFSMNNAANGQGQIVGDGAGAAAFGSHSDSRLKENIVDLANQLNNILALRPVEFDYIESEGGGHQIGFIAQEMQEVYPDVVGARDPDSMLTITGWSKTEARLVKAIQEQQALITQLTARITALETA